MQHEQTLYQPPRPRVADTVAAPRTRTALDQLLDDVGRGHPAAFVELYCSTVTRVYSRVRRVIGDAAHAEDVTQDVYLEVWRRAENFDATRGSAIGWILQLAHSRSVDRIRRLEAAHRRESAHAHDRVNQAVDPVAARIARAEAAELVHAALAALTPLQRQAISLVYLEGHTHEAASRLLGISLPAFKTRVHDGMLALRGRPRRRS